jgi:hypothetical protein
MLLLEYSLTKEDYFNFNYYTTWQAPEKKSYRLKYWLKMASYILIGISIPVIMEPRPLTLKNLLPLLIIFIVLLFLSVYLYTKYYLKISVNKFLEKPDNCHVLLKTQLIISDTAIKEISEVAETTYKWEAIKNKIENKDYWYLYLNTNYGIVIPKRFLNKMERCEFESFLSRNLPLTSEFRIK